MNKMWCFRLIFKKLQNISIFQQVSKIVSLFSLKFETCFTFFDKMQKVFHFFGQKAKIVSHFFKNEISLSLSLTKCKNCFPFFDKIRKLFLHGLHFSNWFYAMGTSIIWYSLKSLHITTTMCQTWIGISIRSRKHQRLFLALWRSFWAMS